MFNQGSGRGRGMGRGHGSGMGMGGNGYCVCPSCNYRIPHQRGVPCTQTICPHCHKPMIREGIGTSQSYTRPIAYVVKEKCTGCKVCMNTCPKDAMIFNNGKVEIIEDKCIGCMVCANACPVNAIISK